MQEGFEENFPQTVERLNTTYKSEKLANIGNPLHSIAYCLDEELIMTHPLSLKLVGVLQYKTQCFISNEQEKTTDSDNLSNYPTEMTRALQNFIELIEIHRIEIEMTRKRAKKLKEQVEAEIERAKSYRDNDEVTIRKRQVSRYTNHLCNQMRAFLHSFCIDDEPQSGTIKHRIEEYSARQDALFNEIQSPLKFAEIPKVFIRPTPKHMQIT